MSVFFLIISLSDINIFKPEERTEIGWNGGTAKEAGDELNKNHARINPVTVIVLEHCL
jgi:hypothetical protein